MELSTSAAEAVENGQVKRTILLPCDDTDATDRAVDWVLRSFYAPGDVVHVMTVIPLPAAQMADFAGGMAFEYIPLVLDSDPRATPESACLQEDLRHIAGARAFLKRRVLDRLAAAGVPYKSGITHFMTDSASIGEAVCARADYLKADVVVMVKHQRGLLASMVLGSVTSYCLSHLKQPLVLLH